MKVKSLLLQGDSNVGLHVFATNKFVLIGMELSSKELKELKEVFNVPVHSLTIGGTSLLGVFLTGNEEKVLVPSIIFDSEKKKFEGLGINYEIFPTEHTCLGNNIALKGDTALVHVDFSNKEIAALKKALGLKHVHQMMIADVETVGSCLVMNNKGGLVHRFASTKEVSDLKKYFGIELGLGTVNMGSPLIKSGVACNDYGFIVGKNSGGPEMVNIDENLRGSD